MKTSVSAGLLALCGVCAAQTPDLVIRTDLRYTITTKNDGGSQARWYDPMGRHSIVGLQLLLEPGYRALVTQRLQKIDNDPDKDMVDEAYVEDPGLWRVGKQYLPFGSKVLIRESAPAFRGDTRLVFDNLPIQFAACDGGTGLTRGVVGRIGARLGVSFAIGDHFGVAGTNLAPVRRPEEAPPKGGGYRLVVGADYKQRFGPATLEAEVIAMRRPNRTSDAREEVSDLRATVAGLDDRFRLTSAWARAWRAKRDVYRFEAEMLVQKDVWVTGFVRFDRGQVRDLSIGARVKL